MAPFRRRKLIRTARITILAIPVERRVTQYWSAPMISPLALIPRAIAMSTLSVSLRKWTEPS
jgi:hypothetical protein